MFLMIGGPFHGQRKGKGKSPSVIELEHRENSYLGLVVRGSYVIYEPFRTVNIVNDVAPWWYRDCELRRTTMLEF